MLIQFEVSNFLSFNKNETFSMVASKTRKHSDRIFNNKKFKLTKCEVILGANASGKTNLISAFKFMQEIIIHGFPRGFSNKYFRLLPQNKYHPSNFTIQILENGKVFEYSFSAILATGSIISEHLHEILSSDARKSLYERNTEEEKFIVGSFFKQIDAISKLMNYGEDSANDQEVLFLSLINRNKGKMFTDFPELKILRDIFNWFILRLNISFPESILTGYPYFTDTNIAEISELLHALGTGISELKIVEVPAEVIKSKVPEELYNKIVSDLEKENARTSRNADNIPQITIRSYKEFYTFEISPENNIRITTIEFSHERQNIFFDLNEESDGTARLLDLIEILFEISNDQIFVIDEIDRCLHPAMTVKLIELFLEKAKARNTQLIITSHESRLLAADILRNDEICFVVKDENGASVINPLEKYQLRADKKVYAALFDGTLDAGPNFDNNKLASLTHTSNI